MFVISLFLFTSQQYWELWKCVSIVWTPPLINSDNPTRHVYFYHRRTNSIQQKWLRQWPTPAGRPRPPFTMMKNLQSRLPRVRQPIEGQDEVLSAPRSTTKMTLQTMWRRYVISTNNILYTTLCRVYFCVTSSHHIKICWKSLGKVPLPNDSSLVNV